MRERPQRPFRRAEYRDSVLAKHHVEFRRDRRLVAKHSDHGGLAGSDDRGQHGPSFVDRLIGRARHRQHGEAADGRIGNKRGRGPRPDSEILDHLCGHVDRIVGRGERRQRRPQGCARCG